MHKLKADKKLIVILGPTGIGKSKLAVKLARLLNTVILSADSRQVYKEMNIGTAKPEKKEMEGIPHYLLDHISIDQEYSVGNFEKEGLEVLKELFKKHDNIILVGGTGLYIKALCEGLDQFPSVPDTVVKHLNNEFENHGITPLQEKLKQQDPEYFELVDIYNHRRLIRALSVIESSGKKFSSYLNKKPENRDFSSHYLFLEMDRKLLYDKINARVDNMIQAGLVEEVKSLLKYKDVKALESVGYQEIFRYLEGEWTLEFAIEKIKQHTRNYAKRQLTWMRKIKDARWFNVDQQESIIDFINQLLKEEDQ